MPGWAVHALASLRSLLLFSILLGHSTLLPLLGQESLLSQSVNPSAKTGSAPPTQELRRGPQSLRGREVKCLLRVPNKLGAQPGKSLGLAFPIPFSQGRGTLPGASCPALLENSFLQSHAMPVASSSRSTGSFSSVAPRPGSNYVVLHLVNLTPLLKPCLPIR